MKNRAMTTERSFGLRLATGLMLMAALATVPLTASALILDIDYSYNGGALVLDAGSDDPIGVNLQPGDGFNLNIQTVGNDFWKVDVTQGYFPFLAFTTDESATRDISYSLDLLLDGVSQFMIAPTADAVAQVHLGTNTVNLTAGLMFDEIILDLSLLSTTGTGNTTLTNLPIGGQVPGGFNSGISYNRAPIDPPAGVPAPPVALLMLAGALLLAGRRWQG